MTSGVQALENKSSYIYIADEELDFRVKTSISNYKSMLLMVNKALRILIIIAASTPYSVIYGNMTVKLYSA